MIEQQEDLEGKVVSTGQAVSLPHLGGLLGKWKLVSPIPLDP